MSEDLNQWKGAWLARVNVMGGGCWSRSHESKAEALRGLKRQLLSDWSHLFDIKAALKEGIKVSIYKDGGTKSWDDDEFVETAVLY